jgi:hypothetical protein
MIRGQKALGFLAQREKIITIILNEDKIYINILHTYRGSGFSFLHGLSDYLKCKNIAKSFTLAQL